MESEGFKKEDLRRNDCQYTVRHTSVDAFAPGQMVFLKSNPERLLEVVSITDISICVLHVTGLDRLRFYIFPPEMILQYKYAGLVTYRQKYPVCLN